MDNLISIVIIINAIVAGIVFGLALMRGWMLFPQFNRREKVYHNSLLFYTFSAMVVSLTDHDPQGWEKLSSLVIFVANVYAVRGFISYYKEIFRTTVATVVHEEEPEVIEEMIAEVKKEDQA